MLTAAVYARYSSERQRATSIDDQLRLCQETAARLGCTILEDHVYTDQEISAPSSSAQHTGDCSRLQKRISSRPSSSSPKTACGVIRGKCTTR